MKKKSTRQWLDTFGQTLMAFSLFFILGTQSVAANESQPSNIDETSEQSAIISANKSPVSPFEDNPLNSEGTSASEEPSPVTVTDEEQDLSEAQTSPNTENGSTANPEVGDKSSSIADVEQEPAADSEADVPAEEQTAHSSVDKPAAEDKLEPAQQSEKATPTAQVYGAAASGSTNNQSVQADRISGSDRFATAVATSKAGWTTASRVFLANGYKFTDSLTGSPLADLYNSPILLTKENDLPAATLNEIKRLKPTQVTILGGEVSVSANVVAILQKNGLTVNRISGKDRYEQAALVADEIMKVKGNNRDAFIASGEIFSDAMSIAPVASIKNLPIYLTRPNTVHPMIIQANAKVNAWTIIGGTSTVSQDVMNQLKNLGAEVKRIEGADRYEVNRQIIQHYGISKEHMYVASGDAFADALPASVLAAKKGSGLLLIKNNDQTIREQKEFAQKDRQVKSFTFIGGLNTISAKTVDDFKKPLVTYTVYLDPGHGSWDTGAYYYDTAEKDLNLSIAWKTKALLEDMGYIIKMSRTDDDTNLALLDRAIAANSSGADIFVSIHNNAFPANGSVNGIETYYYEYYPDYPSAINQANHNSPTRLAASSKLANSIHSNVVSDTGAYNRGVLRNTFAVLRETKMPAVLLELGYMSNYTELQRLKTYSYQNILANAIATGIDQYFKV